MVKMNNHNGLWWLDAPEEYLPTVYVLGYKDSPGIVGVFSTYEEPERVEKFQVHDTYILALTVGMLHRYWEK